MDIKNYLSQEQYVDMRVRSKLRQIEELNALAVSCSADMTETVEKITGLKNEIYADVDRLIALKKDIEDTIRSVDNPEYQTLLEKRYLCCQPWRKIADDMGYNLRYVHKLHNKALEKCRIPGENSAI